VKASACTNAGDQDPRTYLGCLGHLPSFKYVLIEYLVAVSGVNAEESNLQTLAGLEEAKEHITQLLRNQRS